MRSSVRQRWIPVCSLICLGAVVASGATVPLGELDLTKMSTGWGKPQVNKSITARTLSIGGRSFETGVATHAESICYIALDGKTERFSAWVGVDDATGPRGSVRFKVYGDGKVLFDSGLMTGNDEAKRVDVSLAGVTQMILLVSSGGDGIDYDHANWAGAEFIVGGDKPTTVDAPRPPAEEKVLLTPKPGPAPQINGPKVYGCRPGHPFLYRIPCTGTRPIAFGAAGLPETLRLDASTGIITGTVPTPRGEYVVTLEAKNDHGSDRRTFAIIVGDTLALTPPMGWNSWYIHYYHVTEEHMRNAADVMISSGMADYGYSYVNIDDCWMKRRGDEPYRDAKGAILPNAKFPDIKGMVDHIHSKGLKAGLYTGPGPWTCAGYVASYEHERVDAEKFAERGFDFLKHDWCSYSEVAGGTDLEHLKRPYQLMGDILKSLDRDIILNLCQYGMGNVWTWGGEVGGHCWRTTGDLGLEQGGLLPGFYRIGLSNARHFEYARPGQWNDPDYILIGHIGNAYQHDEPPKPTPLTPSEQYSYMSMWCLMAAPLFYSGDMRYLDEFTLNVLCNAEVIDVDQDPLGIQARPLVQDDETLIMAKAMADGSLAVGLFNLAELPREMSVDWPLLGLSGKRLVRDLWRQKDLGTYDSRFAANVSRHGVALVRLIPAP
ncbi:MAG TPA: NPCBM/NEW2 domain-containing protein [Sedimentisphaerales bacterium]|nr:NPCBM/NEW2 domain-containing protein [Sedimentisphaerales bacterium]HRS13082.1 NPCBM/NEW2 domain-containing protein [Sedimentisphaerales bacterium]HRV46422.1 NPCBM/NEW2 domain-containing protein [Sedimentisphaerales bacterium]